jgi:RNA polymerase sigma-70 factor, ECF subfamily
MRADRVLLEALKDGDNAAFEELFERYYPQVYSVSLRVLGSPEDAEEVSLDVFMRLYERPVEKLADGALGGWLYRSTLNASFNSLRSRKRRLGWLRRATVLQKPEPTSIAGPSETLERNEQIEQVRRGLARIPEKQRNALVLRSHGFQYTEIATILSVAPSSVGTILARGERALRRQLENEVEL